MNALHMLIRASVTAGKNGVISARFLLARKCWLKPQIARTALILTIAGLSAASPVTVASINRVMAGAETCDGNLDPIQRHRPSKNGDAGLLTSFRTTFSRNPIIYICTSLCVMFMIVVSLENVNKCVLGHDYLNV